MTELATKTDTVIETENHIFIHPPDKTGTSAEQCFHCGKPAAQHRWPSPNPWPPPQKEPSRIKRSVE